MATAPLDAVLSPRKAQRDAASAFASSGQSIARALCRDVPIVLQKSPRRSCRIKIRNNRIGANGFLNQRCALTPDLESILRTQTGKILLQQNLPNALGRLLGAEVAHRRRQRSIAEVDDRPPDDGSAPVDDEAKTSALVEECQPIAPGILIHAALAQAGDLSFAHHRLNP